MLGVAVATAVIGVVQTWLSTSVGQRVMHRLRSDLFAHLQRQSLDFFTRTRGGEVQSRLVNDIGSMQGVVTQTATSIAANVTVVVGTAVAMVALSWRLALISLVVLPPAVLLTRQVARMRHRITAERQRRLADLHVQIEEGLSVSGVLLTKTLGASPRLTARFEETSADLVGLEIRSRLAGRWRMATMNVVFAAVPAAIYLAAGFPATSGGMTIGTLVAFIALQGTLFRPLMGLLNVGVDLTASLALFSRIFEYADLPVDIAEPDEPVRLDPRRVRGEVRFEDVGFSYDGERPVLGRHRPRRAGGRHARPRRRDRQRQVDARLARPAPARRDVRAGAASTASTCATWPAADLAAVVGVVTQETYLMHASVRDNLRHARPDATDAEIEQACRSARIHDLIASLPEGYDTVVGSRGHRFSGGEKQRLAIARTLLRDPAVLVLDEATSALDNETERAILATLDDVTRSRTTITIAHRLSTVRNADQIAVLHAGRVVELGTHEELLLRGGRYADLVRGGLGAEPAAA